MQLRKDLAELIINGHEEIAAERVCMLLNIVLDFTFFYLFLIKFYIHINVNVNLKFHQKMMVLFN